MLRFHNYTSISNAHEEGAWAIKSCPNLGQESFLTAGMDGMIRCWSTSTANENVGMDRNDDSKDKMNQNVSQLCRMVSEFKAHALAINSLDISKDGQIAVSSSLDGFVKVWNTVDWSEKIKIDANMAEAWGISIDPKNMHVAGSSHMGKINVWNCQTGEKSMVIDLSESNQKDVGKMAMCVQYNADGSLLATGSTDGAVKIVDSETGKLVSVMKAHTKPVRALCFSPSEPHELFSVGDDACLNFYDFKNEQLSATCRGHSEGILSLDVSPEGLQIVTGSTDTQVKIWDRKNRECLHTFSNHTDQVWGVSYYANGTRLASVSDDCSICIQDCGRSDMVTN